ncbi:MAG: hypothetical protein ACK46X_12685 [Candidatus Sericytochromatia bacterium]
MGRRQMPRAPEVKVAVRAEARQPVWFELTAAAAIAVLAVALVGLGWLGAPGGTP